MATSQHKLLIANRGEIALRIIRSADDLGVSTLSVYTDADSSAPHVFKATESVLVPSYIDQEHLVDLCKEHNVTMVHPGYGFLSENEVSLPPSERSLLSSPPEVLSHTLTSDTPLQEFARRVQDAGITWLGPTPEQIKSMGLKHEARARAVAANVPVLPGSELVATIEAALEQANKVGYPVMLKATGGGGGMGMSVCWNDDELKKAFKSTIDLSQVSSLASEPDLYCACY